MSGRARAGLEAGGRLLLVVAERFGEEIETLSARLADTIRGGGRVLTCGNGGSAADAQHVACELAGRFRLERAPLDVLALTTNPSLVTALANDYGYAEVFARQVVAHGREGDALLLFTTSGTSPNMVRALEEATRRGLWTVAFTGTQGEGFAAGCDAGFVVPSRDVPRIQEAHIAIGHALCECVEAVLFGNDREGKGPGPGQVG